MRIGLTPGASFSSFVTEMMDGFRKLYPDILITLYENDSAALFHALLEGDIDVGFTGPPASDERIQLDELFDEELLVAMPANHPLASGPSISVKSLAEQAYISVPRNIAPATFDCISAAFEDAGVMPRIVQEAPQLATAINLVAAGTGVTIVPSSLRHVHPNEVAYRPVHDATLSASLCLGSRRGEPAVSVRNFIKLTRKAAFDHRKSANMRRS